MAANVETMFYTGEVPWHGMGVGVEEAPNSAEAIRLAGLDWTVEKKPAGFLANPDSKNRLTQGFTAVKDDYYTVRQSDSTALGRVTERYKIVQNVEAFDFTDKLLGAGVTYETAGSLANGKRIWLTARMPSTTILGDDVDPYLVFTNSHDGSGAVKVAITPVRVVCQNTLTIALRRAKRVASIKHCGDIGSKIHEAEKVLGMAATYMNNMNAEAEALQEIKIDETMFNLFLEKMFPLPAGKSEDELSERTKTNINAQREAFDFLYKEKDDIKKFGNSGWALLNAVGDFVPHFRPARTTGTYQENNFMKIVDGGKNNLMERASAFVYSIA